MSRMSDARGVALLVVLLVTLFLTGVGVALALVTSVDLQLARSFRDGHEALQAAEASLERVAQELGGAPAWTDVLVGAFGSQLADTTLSPNLPGGGATIDLVAITSDLQQDRAGRQAWGTAPPIWRLYAWGPASNVYAPHAADCRLYVAVWVADDPSDDDGNGLADSNDALILHAEAFGSGGTRREVEAVVARRTLNGAVLPGVRLVAWEEVR